MIKDALSGEYNRISSSMASYGASGGYFKNDGGGGNGGNNNYMQAKLSGETPAEPTSRNNGQAS